MIIQKSISATDIYDFSLEDKQQENLFDLCSNPKLSLQNDEANEPDLTAQQLIQEDCRKLIRLEMTMLDSPSDMDHSTNSRMTDSTGETEVTALEDIGARQRMAQMVVSNGNDDQSVVSVSYDGIFVRWMENDESKRCLVCGKLFRWWRRRHVSYDEGRLVVALSYLWSFDMFFMQSV